MNGKPPQSNTSRAVRTRATRGIGVLTLQTLVVKGAMFISNIVLARMLAPRQFGVVAIGIALVGVASILSDGGIGVGLIRGPKEPDPADLRSMLGLQLLCTCLFAAVTGAVGVHFGQLGKVTALIALTLPLSTLSSSGAVLLERRLMYGTVAIVEAASTAAFIVAAITSVALGAGVWGLAGARVVQGLARGAVTLALVPDARVGPRFHFGRIRHLLGFGTLYQASCLVDVGRDQAINSGTAAISGLGTLGLWTVAGNIAQAPFALFGILSRVSFPTIARLIEGGSDPSHELEDVQELVAVVLGLLAVGLVGTGPVMVPLLFGHAWRGAIPTLPWIGAGLLLTAPVNVVLGGYLLARKRAAIVLWANVVEVVANVVVGLALLPLLGVQALGVGFLLGAVVDMPIFRRGVREFAPVRVVTPILLPVCAATAASALGWFVARWLGVTAVSLLASGAVAGLVYLCMVALVSRRALLACRRYFRLAMSLPPVGAHSRGVRAQLESGAP